MQVLPFKLFPMKAFKVVRSSVIAGVLSAALGASLWLPATAVEDEFEAIPVGTPNSVDSVRSGSSGRSGPGQPSDKQIKKQQWQEAQQRRKEELARKKAEWQNSPQHTNPRLYRTSGERSIQSGSGEPGFDDHNVQLPESELRRLELQPSPGLSPGLPSPLQPGAPASQANPLQGDAIDTAPITPVQAGQNIQDLKVEDDAHKKAPHTSGISSRAAQIGKNNLMRVERRGVNYGRHMINRQTSKIKRYVRVPPVHVRW